MTPDPTAVRAAAERLTTKRAKGGVFDGSDAERSELGRLVARAYLALTDPTPLTVEVLVEMGFEKELYTIDQWSNGRILVQPFYALNLWNWWEKFGTNMRAVIRPAPRTVGELAMLITMTEGR